MDCRAFTGTPLSAEQRGQESDDTPERVTDGAEGTAYGVSCALGLREQVEAGKSDEAPDQQLLGHYAPLSGIPMWTAV